MTRFSLRLWRRRLALLAALLPFIAAPAFGETASPASWDKVLAAAKSEGKVVISHFTDAGFPAIFKQFEDTYGIKVEANPGRPNAVIPKIVTEQQNGQYNWDVLLQPVNNVRLVLEPAGGLEPILPLLILPEVTNEANWYGGLTGKVPMNPLYVFYDGISNLAVGIDVNRDKVSAADMSNWPDLLDPKWKKRFGIYYAGRPNNLTIALTCWRPAFDSEAKWEDYVRAFFAQQPVASPEFRIVADWLVQGRFDVTVGGEGSYLDSVKQKLQRNIVAPVSQNLCGYPPTGTGRSISVPKNPPDRNAAIVFVNWYLTKEAQDAIVKAFVADGEDSVSRRTDATNPNPALQQKVVTGFKEGWLQGKGIMTDGDDGLKLQQRVIDLALQAGY